MGKWVKVILPDTGMTTGMVMGERIPKKKV